MLLSPFPLPVICLLFPSLPPTSYIYLLRSLNTISALITRFHHVCFLLTAITWSTCYYYPPSQHPLLKQPIAKMLSAIPSGIGNKFQQNGFLNSKFGSAYIESSCCRKIIRPFTLPGKLYVTFKAVEAWGERDGSMGSKKIRSIQPALSCLFMPLLTGLSDVDDVIF